ncbi:MAG: translation initiation factor IF-3 [Pseudomonadota bacterium]|nr:translation initiation factor IF-3 [Alphaproteobacteria bacterium]MEC7575972.1 translation initiation factor IF-3 [Pseudomonadota bacterium]MCS5597124.1 translation initiation factor IF-3 [Alphaproteobacteria bacterium]MEC7702247.1 translation initiation factor IF-3 [Pseudomonadota bacterium]MEC9236450.1 translation initiation factor IF-3 [Pseudomonadota bacterium]
MRGPVKPQRPVDDGPRINEDIRVKEVRLIDDEGEMLGVVGIKEALAKAEEAGLDLVEVSPNAEPPVCKILDYGKYKYEQQKKANEARKKQKTIDLKEVKIRPTTEEHDYQVKLRNVKRFLSAGNKVKVSMRFRGREMAHQDVGMKLMERMLGDVEGLGKADMGPKMEGRQMIMVLSAEGQAV